MITFFSNEQDPFLKDSCEVLNKLIKLRFYEKTHSNYRIEVKRTKFEHPETRGRYSPLLKTIYLTTNIDDTNLKTLFHEAGHVVDNILCKKDGLHVYWSTAIKILRKEVSSTYNIYKKNNKDYKKASKEKRIRQKLKKITIFLFVRTMFLIFYRTMIKGHVFKFTLLNYDEKSKATELYLKVIKQKDINSEFDSDDIYFYTVHEIFARYMEVWFFEYAKKENIILPKNNWITQDNYSKIFNEVEEYLKDVTESVRI